MQEHDIQLHKWFSSNLGAAVLQEEWQHINNFCKKIRGESKLIMTGADVSGFTNRDHLKKTIFLSSHNPFKYYKDNLIISKYDELPLEFCSVDCIIINHVLEFTLNPYKILREVDKIIKPNGYVIISSFNAFSFYGLQKIFLTKKKFLKSSNCWGLRQIEEWLKVLSFKIARDEQVFFRPFINNKFLLNHTKFFNLIGRIFFAGCGGVNLIYAKKQISGLTPIKNRWVLVDSFLNPGLAKSAT